MKYLLVTSLMLAYPLIILDKDPDISTTAIVTFVGSHIASKDNPVVNKYPRKNCPVCKGTGKYISGDGIKEVDCGYCESDKKTSNLTDTDKCECKTCSCAKCECGHLKIK